MDKFTALMYILPLTHNSVKYCTRQTECIIVNYIYNYRLYVHYLKPNVLLQT